jgi:cystathionine beta-lyase
MSLNADRFSFDFRAMDELPTHPSDLFMLCHPHNPVGTVFNSDELNRFAQWALERELYVCSDEIHCDLLLEPDLKHIPLASVSPEIADRTITLMAPSKTFNLPGFGCSFAIISNGELRRKFKKAISGIVPDPPAMGFTLAETAYRTGEPWRLELIDYLRGNRDLALDALARITGLIPYSPKATYLLWIDARELPVENAHSFFENAGVGLSDGKDFDAPGFLRMNLGCSRELLTQALELMTVSCKGI